MGFLYLKRQEKKFLNIKKTYKKSCKYFLYGARDRTWTGTSYYARRILSPVRLPIPPLGQALS